MPLQFPDSCPKLRHLRHRIGPLQKGRSWAGAKHLGHKRIKGLDPRLSLDCSGTGPKIPAGDNLCMRGGLKKDIEIVQAPWNDAY